MRYLSQLARETTASVTPSRRPSWLHPVGLLIHEEQVEAPSAVATTPASTSRESSTARSVLRGIEESGLDATPAQPARPMASRSRDVHSSAAEADQELNPVRHPRLTRQSRGPEDASAQSAGDTPHSSPRLKSILARPTATDREQHESLSALPANSADRSPKTPAVQSSEATPNLRSVLAEIARRQQELELRYRADQKPEMRAESRAGKRDPEKYLPKRNGNEDVRLNIGSITVQLEPEPAVTAAKPPSPRSPRLPAPTLDTGNRWARSFLDR
jgi:hypothetical protein